jgi:rhamnosyltransferase
MKECTVSVIVPTLQAGPFLSRQIRALHTQTLPPQEIILVDSGSTDSTLEQAELAGCKIINIPQPEFRHGKARNLGALKAQGEKLVFLTQDAIPVHDNFLQILCASIDTNCLAATARQIPYPNANPLEVFSRQFNYPSNSYIRTQADIRKMGIKAFFFSNSASAIRRNEFLMAGGFSESVIVNEDMLLCAQLIRSGGSIAYVAEATVYHSHNYTFNKLFGRYFDIGVFFSQNARELNGVKVTNEGWRFFSQALQYLLKKGMFFWIPRLAIETVIKFIAFQSGKKYRRFPIEICAHLSDQPQFWV